MLRPLSGNDPGRIGPYELKGRIGAGGMGVVYLGFDERGRPAAVKVPAPGLAGDPEFRRRFRDEVSAARRVRGSLVAAVVNFDLDAERPWLATEYVEGKSLADAITARGAFTGRLLDGLAIGLADALVAIHAADVVHRDLKPSNILLAWDGPKVIDFGIARAGDATSHTRTGSTLGTPLWMAPEQLRGERAGPAADIFAWGACVAFAATGRPPFRGERVEAIAVQIMTGEPDLSGVPDPLAAVVRQALVKDATRRPTALELRARLVAMTKGYPDGGNHDLDESVATVLAQWWSLRPTPPEPPGSSGSSEPPGPPGPSHSGRSGAHQFPGPRVAPEDATSPPGRSGSGRRQAFVPDRRAAGGTQYPHAEGYPRPRADGTLPPGPGGTQQPGPGGTQQPGPGGTPRRGSSQVRVLLAVVLALLLVGGGTAAAVVALGRGPGSPDDNRVGAGAPATLTSTPSLLPSSPSPASTSTSTSAPIVSSTSPTSTSTTSTQSTQRRPVAKPARDGDVDGDGKTDRITLVRPGLLEVTYSAGGSNRVPFGSEDPEQRVLGAVDADSDGYAEVFVQASTGAALRSDAAFRYVDGRLRLMTIDNESGQLYRGGSLRNQGSWACRTSTSPIVQWSSTTGDDQTYSGEVRSYRFVDAMMVLTSRVQFQNKREIPAGPGGETPGSGCGSLDLSLR